ncbi:MAG: M20/M25/M40 family metallo-hydrolase [Planctomycetes bacterium]|nr:M20/M25/M40 family metallo-hydrolase [Planctomycetota bacterium]NOG55017.1 M20/M25/M40 family metallo-hydrolase [Planctomycetota bacterium]
MIRMPGSSHTGPLPPLTAHQQQVRDELERDVRLLSETIGPRHVFEYDALVSAAEFIERSLSDAGYTPARQEYEVNNRVVWNIEAALTGTGTPDVASEIVVIGAHYDSVQIGIGDDCPGANDNGTGVAAVLALARHFAEHPPLQRTIRFVLFVNEEPPYFQTSDMGSLVYARACAQRNERIASMLSLETMGYYTDEPKSQQYPAPFGMLYPNTGNFITFVGDIGAGSLVRQAIGVFREHAQFPSEGGALPSFLPGVGWSDHWSFRQQGYPAIMITDTAPNRYPYYHTENDLADHLDFDRLAHVVTGLEPVVVSLATSR